MLKKAAALDIETVCSLHGPVLHKEQLGDVLAAYDTKTGTVHDVDKDGTTYTRPMNWDVYGVIALDDLLAGSTDFTPLNFAE